MRVVQFIDTPRLGGAERLLEQVLEASVGAGHHVTLLSPQGWLVERVAGAIPQVDGRVIGRSLDDNPSSLRRGRALLVQVPRLVRSLRGLRADVLHVHNGGYPGSDLARLLLIASRPAGVKRRILTVHAAPRSRDESIVAVQTAADWMVWRSAQTVIGATSAVREGLVEMRGMPDDGRWVQIPYGVPEPDRDAVAANALRDRLGVGRHGLLVGMISATDDEQKGHHVLVEALAHAHDVHAVVAGAQLPPRAARRAEELGLGERLVSIGRVPSIGGFYEAVDELVVPSVSDESLPLVVLEGMASSIPVIASRLSGIPEAVADGETGILFEPGDAAALAGAIGRLARDPELRRSYGDAGRRRWAARFSVDAMTAATLAQYGRR